MPIEKVMLDMDGVLADFVGGALKAHQRASPYLLQKNLGIFEIEDVWGISAREFWKPIDVLGMSFWIGLDKMPEADALVSLVSTKFGEENVCILTAPAEDPGCIPGKREWIKKNYPSFSKRIIFGSAKEFLAASNHLLLDDRDKNINAFQKAGGRAILVPRLWNASHIRYNEVMPVIEAALIGEGKANAQGS